jgi:uncharacterized YigZ family protein
MRLMRGDPGDGGTGRDSQGGGYPVPAGPARAEQTIRRSRFIAIVARAPDAAAAASLVRDARSEFPDATHHCWASVAGPPASTAAIGMSDDGEPHGSAGRPMLTVLLHAGIGEIVGVVARYYGGTNLGVGGLVRAYGGTLRLALERLAVAERVVRVDVVVEVEYGALASLQRLAAEHLAEVVEESFGKRVLCRIRLPRDRSDAFARAVRDATAGRAEVSPCG